MTAPVPAYRIPRPPLTPTFDDDIPLALRTWATNVARYLIDFQAQNQLIFLDLDQGRQRILLPAQFPSFLAADLIAGINPRPNPPGRAVYCPDDSGGPALAISIGTAWHKITLGGPIS